MGDPCGKCKFSSYVKMTFFSLKSVVFYSEHNQTTEYILVFWKEKQQVKKGQIFYQNCGVNTLEKRKFCDYVKMIFYTLKSVLFYLEHNRPI